MYNRCIACESRLGSNSRLAHLPIGKRIAFDPEHGRLWIICPHCRQWNLMPFEERWEALGECEAQFSAAEGHATTGDIALARCGDQLELLRIGGDARPSDITNYRYGHRLGWRRTRLELFAALLGTVALCGLLVLFRSIDNLWLVAWFTLVLIAYTPASASRILPLLTSLRVAARFRDHDGKTVTLRNYHVRRMTIEAANLSHGLALSCVTRRDAVLFEGRDAAELLAAMLPRVNWRAGDPGTLKRAIRSAGRAETRADIFDDGGRESWAELLEHKGGTRLLALASVELLALEIVATEEHELRLMRGEALRLRLTWKREEGIAAIADALLLPSFVTEWIAQFKARRAPRIPPAPE